MEPLEGTALQEEGCHKEWAVRVYSLILLHILSLSPLLSLCLPQRNENVFRQLPAPAALSCP